MDELELEARLRARLHRRFDRIEPPAVLENAVAAILVARPPMRLLVDRRANLAILAAAAVIVVAGGAMLLRPPLAVGPGASPSPLASVSPNGSSAPIPSESPLALRTLPAISDDRTFLVLPAVGSAPSQADTDQAIRILGIRLATVGLGGSITTFDRIPAFAFGAPPNGASDETIRDLLATPGVITFVGLPAGDYGPSGQQAVVGQPLPVAEPTLIDRSGIATAILAPRGTLTLTLNAAATKTFASYTGGHVGDAFAVLVDGKVSIAPIINEPIPSGSIVVTAPPEGEASLERLGVIAMAGPLPDSWLDARVPVLISQADAAAIALRSVVSGIPPTVEFLGINVTGSPTSPTGLRGVWSVWVNGTYATGCAAPRTPSASPDCRLIPVEVDAVTGEVGKIGW